MFWCDFWETFKNTSLTEHFQMTVTSSEEALKLCKHFLFQEMQRESSVTRVLPIQLQFI